MVLKWLVSLVGSKPKLSKDEAMSLMESLGEPLSAGWSVESMVASFSSIILVKQNSVEFWKGQRGDLEGRKLASGVASSPLHKRQIAGLARLLKFWIWKYTENK